MLIDKNQVLICIMHPAKFKGIQYQNRTQFSEIREQKSKRINLSRTNFVSTQKYSDIFIYNHQELFVVIKKISLIIL